MKKATSKKILIVTAICAVIACLLCYYYLFSSMSTKENNTYVYIDDDDNIDSVYAKLEPIATSNSMSGFKILVKYSSYTENIRTGRYEIEKGMAHLQCSEN